MSFAKLFLIWLRMMVIRGLLLLVGVSVVHGQQTSTLLDDNDRLLVWIGSGAAAGRHSAANPGSLYLLDNTGNLQALVNVPPQSTRVHPCGDVPTSPDGHFFAFFMGLDEGQLFIMRDANVPVMIDTVQALACVGDGFQYAPDSQRMAYMAYERRPTLDEFAAGFLKIYNLDQGAQEQVFENVSAFDINNQGVAFVSLFTNDVGEADEAAIFWWDGNTQREVSALFPDSDNCKFTSTQISIAPDGMLWLMMGHRCTVGETATQWQLYQVDIDLRGATRIGGDRQPGAFFPFSRTNNIFFSPGGGLLYFTVPDGVTANTVALAVLNLGNNTLSVPVARQMVMPTYSGSPNSFPQFSPDGRWLAFVVTTPNSENTLTVLDLLNPAVPPIQFSTGTRGDTISNMAFTSDNEHLVFVAGGDESDDNILYVLDLLTGAEIRVRRGRFARGMVVSPDGTRVALGNWQLAEDPRDSPYQHFTVLELETSAEETLILGADIVDGRVTNQIFVYPLAWRRAG